MFSANWWQSYSGLSVCLNSTSLVSFEVGQGPAVPPTYCWRSRPTFGVRVEHGDGCTGEVMVDELAKRHQEQRVHVTWSVPVLEHTAADEPSRRQGASLSVETWVTDTWNHDSWK